MEAGEGQPWEKENEVARGRGGALAAVGLLAANNARR